MNKIFFRVESPLYERAAYWRTRQEALNDFITKAGEIAKDKKTKLICRNCNPVLIDEKKSKQKHVSSWCLALD